MALSIHRHERNTVPQAAMSSMCCSRGSGWGLLGYTDVHPSHDADANAGVRSTTHLIHTDTQYYTLAHPSGERKACAWLPSVLVMYITGIIDIHTLIIYSY